MNYRRSEEWFDANPAPYDGSALIELAGLRALIWEQHYGGLSSEVRLLLDSEKHPFMNPISREACYHFARAFIEEKKKLPFVEDVTVDAFHGGSAVLTVHLGTDMDWKSYASDIPEFWNGVRIMVVRSDR